MWTCARLVCLVTLLAAPAAAQSTTEDGIRAMLRGDYRAAAGILRPLAEDAARPDPAAQFFLAIRMTPATEATTAERADCSGGSPGARIHSRSRPGCSRR